MMRYAGRDLLGTVTDVVTPKRPAAYQRLGVKHFDGEPWPLEPLAWEVHVLVRDDANEETE